MVVASIVAAARHLGMRLRVGVVRACWLAGVAAFAAGPARGQESSIQITFLDVGQGDAIVIRAPDGQTALIDAGSSGPLRYLQQMNVDQIDLLVATHPHADHIGGLVDVLTARPVRFFMDNGQPHTTDTYRRLMATLERLSDVTYLEAVPRTISLGSASFEVLPLLPPGADHNNRSVGLILSFGAFSVFLSGDSERRELTRFVEDGVVPDVTVLKAPHHGSANGFTRDFLRAASPEVVVISVGANNPYRHPRPEALTAYGSVAEHVFRTDRDGHVTVLGYEDGRYEVVLAGETVVFSDTVPVSQTVPTVPTTVPDSAAGDPSPEFSVEVVAGGPGDDSTDLNGEYVAITNRTPDAIEISRWRVCDLSSRCFRFPDGVSIEAGGRVVVYTGYGVDDGRSFFMNNARAVWNDNGDEATLYDAGGVIRSRYVYQ